MPAPSHTSELQVSGVTTGLLLDNHHPTRILPAMHARRHERRPERHANRGTHGGTQRGRQGCARYSGTLR